MTVVADRQHSNGAGDIDLLFTTHNRHEFTEVSFQALLANTNWERIRRLFVIDDRSRDGTLEFMNEMISDVPIRVTLISGKLGGPAIAMNIAAQQGEAPVLAKIDNDVIVCPGWLDEMARVLDDHPDIDALGMEPGFGGHVVPIGGPRGMKRAKWIGGVGLIRRHVFANRRVTLDHRWFGWTAFQRLHVRAAWISPDLPIFLLDHLPLEPWMSHSRRYIRNEWQRAWPTRYPPEWSGYWQWWIDSQSNSALHSSRATS